jgi:integrase
LVEVPELEDDPGLNAAINSLERFSALCWQVAEELGVEEAILDEMPAHHKLEAYIDAYLDAAAIRGQGRTPLFRSTIGKTGILTGLPMHRVDVWRMICRRAADASFQAKIGCHTFRATGITAYLEAGGTLENAQAMAAHESPRTTKLYDRTADVITLDEVERIVI